MGNEKLTVDAFAEKIKAKYPQYKDVDNAELTQKIIKKYPQYSEQVQFDAPSAQDGGSQEAMPFVGGKFVTNLKDLAAPPVSAESVAKNPLEPPKSKFDELIEGTLDYRKSEGIEERAIQQDEAEQEELVYQKDLQDRENQSKANTYIKLIGKPLSYLSEDEKVQAKEIMKQKGIPTSVIESTWYQKERKEIQEAGAKQYNQELADIQKEQETEFQQAGKEPPNPKDILSGRAYQFGINSLNLEQRKLRDIQRKVEQKEKLTPEEHSFAIDFSQKKLYDQYGNLIDKPTPQNIADEAEIGAMVVENTKNYKGKLKDVYEQKYASLKHYDDLMNQVVDTPNGGFTNKELVSAAWQGQRSNPEMEDAIKEAQRVEKLRHTAWKEFEAMKRAYILNIDPAKTGAGLGGRFTDALLEGTKESPVFGFVNEIVDKKHELLSSNNYEKVFEEIANESDLPITEVQKEKFKDTFYEKAADTFGGSLPVMGEIILSTMAANYLGGVSGISRLSKLYNFAIGKKYGKGAEFMANLVDNSMKGFITYAPTQESGATGVGEGSAQQFIDMLNPEKWAGGKYRKFFEYAARVGTGLTGETAQEYSGQFVNSLVENGTDWEEVFSQTFGRTPEDQQDQLLLTMLQSALFSGAFNLGVLKDGLVALKKSSKPEAKDVVNVVEQVIEEREADAKKPPEEPPATGGVTEPSVKSEIAATDTEIKEILETAKSETEGGKPLSTTSKEATLDKLQKLKKPTLEVAAEVTKPVVEAPVEAGNVEVSGDAESAIEEIIYHGTSKKFDKLKVSEDIENPEYESENGVHFNSTKQGAQRFGSTVIGKSIKGLNIFDAGDKTRFQFVVDWLVKNKNKTNEEAVDMARNKKTFKAVNDMVLDKMDTQGYDGIKLANEYRDGSNDYWITKDGLSKMQDAVEKVKPTETPAAQEVVAEEKVTKVDKTKDVQKEVAQKRKAILFHNGTHETLGMEGDRFYRMGETDSKPIYITEKEAIEFAWDTGRFRSAKDLGKPMTDKQENSIREELGLPVKTENVKPQAKQTEAKEMGLQVTTPTGNLIDGDKLNAIQDKISNGENLNSKEQREREMFEEAGWKFKIPIGQKASTAKQALEENPALSLEGFAKMQGKQKEAVRKEWESAFDEQMKNDKWVKRYNATKALPQGAVREIGSKKYKESKSHIQGKERTKTLPDGTKLKGRYKVVSADEVIASHNEETFSKSEGFPVNEKGKTVNDRDYETDKAAQAQVIDIANKLDDRAISQTPTVTKDGIVVDGNNRTMSRKLAAKQGTDKAYVDALKNDAEMYGIDAAEIDNVKNPMLVFEATEDLPYTTQTFAKFNKAEKKEKSPIEKAVELSKTLSDRAKRVLGDIYERAERPSDVTSLPKTMNEVKKLLVDEGILQTNELPKYINPETGTATKEGVAFLETLLLGASLNEDVIRMLDNEGMGNAKQRILKAVVPLTQNSALGNDALIDNIENGIRLLNKANSTNQTVVDVIIQLDMFEASEYSPSDLAVAILLDGDGFGKFLKSYNSEVGKEVLFEGKLTKEKIIDNLLNQKIKNYEQVRKSLRPDAETGKGKVQQGDGRDGQEGTGVREEKQTTVEEVTTSDKPTNKVSFRFLGETLTGTRDGETIKGDDGKTYKVGDKQEQANDVKPIPKASASTQKIYDNIAGAKPNNQTGRVPISPIFGGKPKPISKILFDVTGKIKQRLLYGKPDSGRRKSFGTYNPGNSAIKIRFTGDLDTTAHELGHSIDDLFGVLTDLKTTPNLAVEAELGKFSPFGSKPPKGHPDPAMYKRAEGFAEWLRAYIVNPDVAKTEAPNLYALYESKVSAPYKKALNDFSTDIREWAGATGRDMTLSNIEWKPSEAKGVLGKIFGESAPDNMFTISWADRLSTKFVNPLNAFNKAIEYAKGLKGVDELLPKDDPAILARTMLGSEDKLTNILTNGMLDARNRPLRGNKNLEWLLEPLDNTDAKTIEQDMKDTIAYMVAERTVELKDKLGKDIVTGIGAGIFKDVDVAQKTLDEFNNGDPNKLARIKEAASRYRELADDVLRYMVDKGRMSEETYQQIKDTNTQYVALQRILETSPEDPIEVFAGTSGALASKKEVVRTIKGSTRKIQNPYISLLDMIHKGVKEADRNETLLAFRNLLTESRDMYEGEPNRFADIGVIAKQGDKETIPIFVDGKVEYWKFQKDVYNALKNLDNDGYKLPIVLTAHAKILRWTVTHFPIFQMRNVIRDVQSRVTTSNENSWRNAFGLKDLIGDKEHWNEVARNGGLGAGHYYKDATHYYGLMEVAMHDMAKKKNVIIADPAVFKKGWEKYKDLLYLSEGVNRVAEYRAALRKAEAKGMDDYSARLYAAYKSRDMLDFALMGTWMRVINQLVPFSNAGVQGVRSELSRAAANPTGYSARIVALSIVPAIAMWLLNHRDDDDSEEYEELPSYQRDMFWNIKIGDNKWLAIPKPYGLSTLFGSAIDRTLSYLNGNDKSLDGYAGSVAKLTIPFDESALAPGFQPIIEGVTNYDFFRDKYIVPPYEDALTMSLRNTDRASRLSKVLSKASGFYDQEGAIDPRKIDHFIKSQFSYYGGMAEKLSDVGGGENQFNIVDLGLFKESPAYNSKSVQEFIEFSSKYGLNGTREYLEFNRLAKDYFEAKGAKQKERTSKILIEYAKNELDDMKSRGEAKMNKEEKSGRTTEERVSNSRGTESRINSR